MKKRRNSLLMIVLTLPFLAVGGFVLWAGSAAGPLPEAQEALDSDALVQVVEEPWYTFTPVDGAPAVGLVIYPGGRVDARAYAPMARSVAGAGYLAVIAPMPLNLAFLDADQVTEVQQAYPDIREWVLAGHSLGGAMAARFTARNPRSVDGLVLWAAYPAESDDLSDSNIPIGSIYGTLDGLATLSEIEASRPLLPPQTRWVSIEGGNHAQFGWYGAQSGDNPAAISRQAQQAQILEATLAVLEEVALEVDR